jgi:hypothetical protein
MSNTCCCIVLQYRPLCWRNLSSYYCFVNTLWQPCWGLRLCSYSLGQNYLQSRAQGPSVVRSKDRIHRAGLLSLGTQTSTWNISKYQQCISYFLLTSHTSIVLRTCSWQKYTQLTCYKKKLGINNILSVRLCPGYLMEGTTMVASV